jgi:two-component system chemotaxis response regulator CheV
MTEQSGSQNILLEVGTNELEVITFYLEWLDPLSGEITRSSYGINAAKVRELVAMPEEVTEIINSPPCVKGVFLLRNRTIPLVDLCEWFSYKVNISPEARKLWVVIVAELNGKPFGFITHGVDKVYRISWKQISPPPEMIASSQSITGICQVNEQLIQMIDFERITAAIDPSMVIRSKRGDDAAVMIKQKFHRAVLIADDSKVVLIQLTKTLENAGFKVISHSDGQAAWDYLENLRRENELEQSILAIISDIEMPRMDGHHFCLLVRKQPAYDKIPFILFSSMINEALRRKGESVGADDQITKPELDQLTDRIQEVVKQRER